MTRKLGLLLLIAVVLVLNSVVVRASVPSAPTSQTDSHFLGGDITIEQELRPGANYSRYIVSYPSDGLKIYALMTVPDGQMPSTGWPVIVFNHGYIPPKQYTTTGNYDAYVDAFARHGYVIFKSDYRGHGKSEGSALHARSGYVTDVLNAVALLKQNTYVDPNRIGMWGHSMGGYVTVSAMLASKDIKAGVVWAGTLRQFKDSNLLKNLSGPLQLQHATGDQTVPVATTLNFAKIMDAANLKYELYIYQGDNHNLTQDATTALTRSLYFFDKYVKNAPAAVQYP